MVYQVPQFLMGQAAQLDFSPVQNALAKWQQAQQFNAKQAQDQSQFNTTNALARDQLAQNQSQFNATNALAVRGANRADELQPFHVKQIEAQIAHMQQQGASEAQLAPLKMQHMQAQTQLAQAQAKAAGTKDVFTEAIGGMVKSMLPQPQQAPGAPAIGAQPQLQPQSFDGQAPMSPTNALAPRQTGGITSTDPYLIQAADGPGPAPQPSAAPDLVDTPAGKMPLDQAKKFGFVLALGGKGDAGKLFTDAANADHLDKTAKGEVQKDMVGLVGTIGRLEAIEKRFDPKFLEIPKRAGMAWAGLKDKFGAMSDENIAKMAPAARDEALKQKSELTRYTQFRQSSVQNAALYVKYLSGVAVSEQEYARIMKTLPNAGTSIADGDSPTEFQAKMKESVTQAKMAYARANYLNTQGFKGKPWEAGVALDDMRGIIDQRGAQIEQELQGRVPAERMQGAVRQKLKQEFGI